MGEGTGHIYVCSYKKGEHVQILENIMTLVGGGANTCLYSTKYNYGGGGGGYMSIYYEMQLYRGRTFQILGNVVKLGRGGGGLVT